MDVSASGNYNISCDEDGDYILVAVSYNEDGELQEVDTDSFEYAVDSVDDVITS